MVNRSSSDQRLYWLLLLVVRWRWQTCLISLALNTQHPKPPCVFCEVRTRKLRDVLRPGKQSSRQERWEFWSHSRFPLTSPKNTSEIDKRQTQQRSAEQYTRMLQKSSQIFLAAHAVSGLMVLVSESQACRCAGGVGFRVEALGFRFY